MKELETDRLRLRKLRKEDAQRIFDYWASDPEVTKYLLWNPHESETYSRRYLVYLQSRYRAGDFYDWAVVWRETGKMIGTCGFTNLRLETNSGEVGYVLNPDFWGMGIAPEAVKRVLRFGFLELRLHRLEARYMIGNDRSRRVMDKVGMRFEGVSRDAVFVRGQYVSVGVCSILSGEWRDLYL